MQRVLIGKLKFGRKTGFVTFIQNLIKRFNQNDENSYKHEKGIEI